MTKDRRFKDVVRRYAAEHGVNYTTALRALRAGDAAGSANPAVVTDAHWHITSRLLSQDLADIHLAIPDGLPSLTDPYIADVQPWATAGAAVTRFFVERKDSYPLELHQDEELSLVRVGGYLPRAQAGNWVTAGAATYADWESPSDASEPVAIEFTKQYELVTVSDVRVDPDFPELEESDISHHYWADGGQ